MPHDLSRHASHVSAMSFSMEGAKVSVSTFFAGHTQRFQSGPARPQLHKGEEIYTFAKSQAQQRLKSLEYADKTVYDLIQKARSSLKNLLISS